MLSHLRFHRRGASNPTSPAPDQDSPSPLSSQQSTFTFDASPIDGRVPSSAASSLPPTLPPITRVTSTELDLLPDELLDAASQLESRPQHVLRSVYNGDSRFIGGAALRNYQRDVEAQQATRRPEPVDNIKSGGNFNDHAQSQRPKPASINTNFPTKPPPRVLKNAKSATSFSASRLVSEPPPSSSNVTAIEPHKGKKGLPFLKNPMSTLLLRRKTNQNPPNTLPLPLSSRSEEPAYDPRIKGTRVHDFSAPRRRSYIPPSTNDTFTAHSISRSSPATEPEIRPSPVADNRDQALQGDQQSRHLSNASDPTRPASVSTTSQQIAQSSSASSIKTKCSSVEQVLRLESHSVPSVPPKDDVPVPLLQSNPSRASRIITQDREVLSTTAGSTRTARSRNVSLSSVPKHMKSTSSRFSFDMIGAAKQEKLLEERHRQRELDKKAATGSSRDSRFDDFDDDAFDYDAMMDDDGLEEKIPGVNADFDEDDQFLGDEYLEEEADPDNDQDNFAGFLFQRSNPVSSITSPQSSGMVMATPRDVEGKVIGVAMTKDTPGLPNFPLAPEPNSALDHAIGVQFSGLGIQGMDTLDPTSTDAGDASVSRPTSSMPPASIPRTITDDELYFDNGIVGFENEFAEDLAAEPEGDGVPFDESIFDNDDTDQFGRPVPGAFALAQSQRHATNKRPVKRESDMISRLSAQSGIPQSTAHTSPGIEGQKPTSHKVVEAKPVSAPANDDPVAEPNSPSCDGDVMAVYQAALAAAAYKAAASGKFERTSSPLQDVGYSVDTYLSATQYNDTRDDYGYSYDDLDDFELDDDAIIAEANASALANDSDGWYGQEFGFYAAPVNNHGSHQSVPSSLEDCNYANGGFFGTRGGSGVNRSTSGRVASREPNLTPITERSEYSNRNSVMSLGMPAMSGTPTFQSPGLAQLAVMADRGDDQITLSALLRLRSKAWGGSQASLVSSKDGSPRSERGDNPSSPRATSFPGIFPCPTTGHARKNSVFSVVSRDSDAAGSVPGSPTLTVALPILANGPPNESGDVDQDVNRPHGDVASTSLTSPAFHHMAAGSFSSSDVHGIPVSAVLGTAEFNGSQDGCDLSAKGHQRRKGSADSISYMKEEDSGETRWIMERRRTGESGQVEILEREVVDGGRI